MASIGLALANWSSNLPEDWTYGQGLRALFPPGYSGSISPLLHYVQNLYAELSSFQFTADGPYAIGYFWISSDGGGRWFFGWISGSGAMSDSYPRQAGFVFKTPIDGIGLGFVDSSRPAVGTISCAGGTDETLANNWPELSQGGIKISFRIESNPAPSEVWTAAGYGGSNSRALTGSNVPMEGSGSGSSLFPFPSPTTDQIIAGIVATNVAQSLKRKLPVTVDTQAIRTFVTSSASIPSGTGAALKAFLEAPVCDRVISDAKIIGAQVFSIQNQSGAKPNSESTGDSSVLSSQVTADQIIAAGTAAYYSLTKKKSVPQSLWQELRTLNA